MFFTKVCIFAYQNEKKRKIRMIKSEEVTVETAHKLGLLTEEFEQIKKYLGGRTPNFTELSIYSVMWSEHASYKNSIKCGSG